MVEWISKNESNVEKECIRRIMTKKSEKIVVLVVIIVVCVFVVVILVVNITSQSVKSVSQSRPYCQAGGKYLHSRHEKVKLVVRLTSTGVLSTFTLHVLIRKNRPSCPRLDRSWERLEERCKAV